MSRGSIFRKWDLHVHTPKSYESQYKFANDEEDRQYNGRLWDKYVDALEQVTDISVLGVTDYFSIDGYKKVLEYRNEGRLLNFERIFPNIEFRLDVFVGAKRLNYHVLFSDEITPIAIEQEFLGSINITTATGDKRTLRKENIEEIGRQLKQQHKRFRNKTDYYVGCMNITVSLEEMLAVLRSKNSIFGGNHILVVAEPLLASISWDRQDHLTRKVYTIYSDALFSPNENTREWALGKEKSYSSPKEFIDEFGALKPCIHGCDAHDFKKLCKPELDKYCWIKADPTFNGLKQVLYEPEDRVVVCTQNPEPRKNIYTLGSISINAVKVNEELAFSETNLELNRNLITIIGGKGSGKTALLDLIANCFIDRCYRAGIEENSFVQRIEGDNPDLQVSLSFIGPEIDGFSKRFTEDNLFEDVKITYLPQGQIEKYSTQREQLNRKITEVIFNSRQIEETDYEYKYEQFQIDIDHCARRMKEITNVANSLEVESSEAITSEINRNLSNQRGELKNKEAQLTELITLMTPEAQRKIKELRSGERAIRNKISTIEDIQAKCQSLNIHLEFTRDDINTNIESLNSILPVLGDDLNIPVLDITNQQQAIMKVLSVADASISKARAEISEIVESLSKLEGFEKEQSNLLEEINRLKGEIRTSENELETIEEKRGEISRLSQERINLYINMINSFIDWKNFYRTIISAFSRDRSDIMSGVDFYSSIYFNKSSFITVGMDILDNRSVNERDLRDIASVLEYVTSLETKDEVPQYIQQYIQKVINYKSFLKPTRTNEDFYKWSFGNYFNLNTEISFAGRHMDKLSIGQKGTVLLKLFLAEGDYPLIVDQPDENLDNMFIYDELVGAFRQAKTQRQVIIATNNANLVVNTDAEQIIVAEFKDNVISYESGAIEDLKIRKAITTILEGGEEALKKREQKYGM